MQWSLPNALSVIWWPVWAANLVLPFAGTWRDEIHLVGVVILLVHAVECVVFWKRIAATDEAPKHVLFTMLFGIFHVRTLPH